MELVILISNSRTVYIVKLSRTVLETLKKEYCGIITDKNNKSIFLLMGVPLFFFMHVMLKSLVFNQF